MKFAPAWIAAAVMSLSAVPALANSSASASVGPLTIRLIDTDVTDGVTPWIIFRSTFSDENSVSIDVSPPFGAPGISEVTYGASPWAANTLSGASGGVQAWASISGNNTSTGTSFAASGSTSSFTGVLGDAAFFNAEAGAPGFEGNFSLSANTLVVISGNASASASVAGATDSFVSANVFLDLYGPGNLGTGVQLSSDGIGMDHTILAAGDNFAGTEARKLSVSFLNLLGHSATGTFVVSASVSGVSVASPVPEPETYALMLAGLAWTGLMARRRR